MCFLFHVGNSTIYVIVLLPVTQCSWKTSSSFKIPCLRINTGFLPFNFLINGFNHSKLIFFYRSMRWPLFYLLYWTKVQYISIPCEKCKCSEKTLLIIFFAHDHSSTVNLACAVYCIVSAICICLRVLQKEKKGEVYNYCLFLIA